MDTRPSALAVVATGGAVGALARWAVVAAWPTPAGGAGWGTLAVNLLGCLLIGVVAARTEPGSLPRLGLATGVLGGFTTFSTLAVEADRGISAGRAVLALAFVAVSVVGGIALAAIGERLGERLGGRLGPRSGARP